MKNRKNTRPGRAPRDRRLFRYHLILSLSSALLLSAPWLRLGSLPLLVALVPLLVLRRSLLAHAGGGLAFGRMLGWSALTFGGWTALTTWWIWYATPVGPVASVIIGITLSCTAFMAFHWVEARSKKALGYTLLVTAWISLEYLYLTGEISFPWLALGNGFAGDVKLVQWYEYTGIFGGTLWALVSNLTIYEAIVSPARGLRRWAAPATVVLLPAIVSLTLYHTYKEGDRTVKVHIVQPNLDPYEEKFDMPQAEQTALMARLIREAPAGTDYILLPETAIDDNLWEESLRLSDEVRTFRRIVTDEYPGAELIAGASTFRRYDAGQPRTNTARTNENIDFWYDAYNSALHIDSTGKVGIHHKSVLVVGVEKMPYYNLTRHLSFLIVDLGGISGQLGVDTVQQVFDGPHGVRSAVAICYESIYGEYVAGFANKDAEILFVITNDGWWRDTPGYRQHFSYARLRAIETRRAIGRSANTGISGAINPRGDVLASAGWDVRTSLTADLPLSDRKTFYMTYGDYIGRLSAYVLALSILYFIAYRTRRRNHLVD